MSRFRIVCVVLCALISTLSIAAAAHAKRCGILFDHPATAEQMVDEIRAVGGVPYVVWEPISVAYADFKEDGEIHPEAAKRVAGYPRALGWWEEGEAQWPEDTSSQAGQIRSVGPLSDWNPEVHWHHDRLLTPVAHQLTRGAGVTVAVIDPHKIDFSHPQLRAAKASGQIRTHHGLARRQQDGIDGGHATGLAGLVAARPICGADGRLTGILGIAPEAELRSVQLGSPAPIDRIAAYVACAQMDDVSICLDATGSVPRASQHLILSAAVLRAYELCAQKNKLIVRAAGNEDCDLNGRRNSDVVNDSCFVVSALASDYTLASYSNYGETCVDVAACAGSANEPSLVTTRAGGGWKSVRGTSFAAAQAAGVGALIGSRDRSLGGREIGAQLKLTAAGGRKIPTWAGCGVINAGNAVRFGRFAGLMKPADNLRALQLGRRLLLRR